MELEQDQVRADGRCRSGCKAVQIGEIQERKVEKQRLNIFGGGNRKGTGKNTEGTFRDKRRPWKI